MQNQAGRWVAIVAILLSLGIIVTLTMTPIFAQSDIGQETVDAGVQVYFTQTALAYEDLVASATARPEYNMTQTATAMLQSTVNAEFYRDIVATVDAQETAILATAESLADNASIVPLNINNINRVSELYSLPAKSPITDAEFSPSSRWLAVGYETGEIGIWDMQTGETVRGLFGHEPHPVSALMFSPDERILASADEALREGEAVISTIRIWDLQTGQQLHALYGHGVYNVVAMVFSSDGLRLVTLDTTGTAFVWNTLTGERLYRLETERSFGYVAIAYSKFRADQILVIDDNHNIYGFFLPGVEGLYSRSGDPAIAGYLDGFRWDVAEQGEFYNRRGTLLYNADSVRAIDDDTVRSMRGRLLSIDEAHTMLAVAQDTNVQILGVLTGVRADEMATATAYVTATAEQAYDDATATVQLAMTNIAATVAVAGIDDCPGTIAIGPEGAGAILRIVYMQPNENAVLVGAVRAGAEVEITSTVENDEGIWFEIYQGNRRMGYVAAQYVIVQCE